MLCKVVPTRSARVLADKVPHRNPDSGVIRGRDRQGDVARPGTRCWPIVACALATDNASRCLSQTDAWSDGDHSEIELIQAALVDATSEGSSLFAVR
jgi:hypothetical protein